MVFLRIKFIAASLFSGISLSKFIPDSIRPFCRYAVKLVFVCAFPNTDNKFSFEYALVIIEVAISKTPKNLLLFFLQTVFVTLYLNL